ncbi:alpha/beta fold hydrolase [Salinarimonas sp.]|uniref:alpha/beta fold hydrolase n=1 Tax=Salinarimonas sp. TaxID=2766526 RepID=UPI00391D87D1
MKAGTALIAAGAALGLGAAVWDTRRRIARVERRYSVEGRFVEARGVRLHVVSRGSGRPVVLVHGALTMLQDFAASPVPDMLARDARVILVDRPGYGFSSRPRRMGTPDEQARVLREALHRMGVERPVLVGHSFGATVVLAYASLFPDEIAGIVFASGVAFPVPRADLAPMMLPALPGIGPALYEAMLQPLYRLLVPAMVALCFAPQRVPDAFRRAVPTEMMLRRDHMAATAEDLMALVPAVAAMSPRYPRIDVPVAVIAGERDQIAYPRFHGVPLAETLPDATLRIAPGVGHMVQHARPDLIVEAIEEIWERARPGASLSGSAAAERLHRAPDPSHP